MASDNDGFKISQAISITDSELACFYIVKHVLESHKSLSSKDIEYAANYISSFYDYNNQKFLTNEQLMMFLVYTDQKGMCKFALTFNKYLDNAIKNRDIQLLNKYILGSKNMFIELYDNPYLLDNDKEFIIRLISRDFYATTLLFELIKEKVQNPNVSMNQISELNTKFPNIETLTNKCYDKVCIHDAKILDDDKIRAKMSSYERTPESIYTIDKPKYSSIPQVYCFDTLELISAVTQDVPINPKSGTRFSDYSLNLINQRFRKELAMYRRYKSTNVF